MFFFLCFSLIYKSLDNKWWRRKLVIPCREKSAGCDVHLRALIGSGSHDNDDDDYDASGLDSPASIATYIQD